MAAFVGGAVSGAVSGGITARAQAKQSGKQRRFTERLSNTAFQRQKADLLAAGFNPLLAFGGAGGGGGAAVPVPGLANIGDIGGTVLKGVATGLAVKKQKAEIDLIKDQAQLARFKSDESGSATELNRENAKLAKRLQELRSTDNTVSSATARNIDSNTRLNQLQVPGAKAVSDMNKTEAGTFLRQMESVVKGLSPFIPKTTIQRKE